MSCCPTESRKVTITNPNGLHMRPASLVAECCRKFESRIELVNGEVRADGRDVLSILTLFATEGTELELQVAGKDAVEAIEAVASLLGSNFSGD